jgi:hypothetical protein
LFSLSLFQKQLKLPTGLSFFSPEVLKPIIYSEQNALEGFQMNTGQFIDLKLLRPFVQGLFSQPGFSSRNRIVLSL